MSYSFVRHETPRAFLHHAEQWLLRREDLHNLVLGLAYGRAEADEHDPGALFATVEGAAGILGCVLRTPPHKLLLTDMPLRAGPTLVEGVGEVYDRIPAVLGPVPLVEAVAELWVAVKGGAWRAGARQRLHRLDAVTKPAEVHGRLRVGGPDDWNVAREWARAFTDEIGYDVGPTEVTVHGWIEKGRLFLWDHEGPVSMAVAHGRTPSGVRVGYVYTPPECRRRGYAGALVAEVSQRMLDRGLSFCVLYTDLSNPTSNALYQRLGYYPLADVRDYEIVPGEETE